MKANRLKRIIAEELRKVKKNREEIIEQMLTEAEFECCTVENPSATDIECCTAILCNCCHYSLNCCESGYEDCTDEELNPGGDRIATGGGPRAAGSSGQIGEQKGGCGCNKNKR